jgi:hypothetical protein
MKIRFSAYFVVLPSTLTVSITAAYIITTIHSEIITYLVVFNKLITALRTAVDNDGSLGKEATTYKDMFDTFRLV